MLDSRTEGKWLTISHWGGAPQTKRNAGQQLHYASSHVVIKFVLTLTYDNLLKWFVSLLGFYKQLYLSILHDEMAKNYLLCLFTTGIWNFLKIYFNFGVLLRLENWQEKEWNLLCLLRPTALKTLQCYFIKDLPRIPTKEVLSFYCNVVVKLKQPS